MPEDRLAIGPIYVKKSPIHGYGVFAAQDLAANQVIEECHVLFYDTDKDPLSNYAFSFLEKHAIPLGFGCIYNHSDQPNVQYDLDPKRQLVLFTTLRPLPAGEELLISYGKHWFAARKLRPRTAGLWQRFYYNGGRTLLRTGLLIAAFLAFTQGLRYLSF